MISESTPFGWNVVPHPNLNTTTTTTTTNVVNNDNVWELWFQPTLDIIEEYDIGMWSYINCNWESQPMWKGVGFGNTLLSNTNDIMIKWKQYVLNNPRFLNTSPKFIFIPIVATKMKIKIDPQFEAPTPSIFLALVKDKAIPTAVAMTINQKNPEPKNERIFLHVCESIRFIKSLKNILRYFDAK